jgi:hypothetical protein
VDICPPRRGNRKGVVERQLADAEPLRRCPPAPFPAELQATHAVTGKGWCRFQGKFYSVPPGMTGAKITLRHLQ